MSPSLISESTQGVIPIAPTPFCENGDIDWPSLDRLTDHYIDIGADGVTVLGLLGEADKLSDEESLAIVRRVIDRVAGRVPVIVGSTAKGLDIIARSLQRVMDLGAGGIMIAPRPGLRTDEQIYAYFDAVFGRLGEVPAVLQDYPQATNVWMSPALLNRICDDFASVKILKHEDCPGLQKLERIRQYNTMKGRRTISILVGNNALYLPQELARGANGANTGFAYPEMLIEVCRLHRAGDTDAAETLFDAYLPLLRYEQQPGYGLAVRKEIYRRRGLIACAALRAPGYRLSRTDHAELERLMTRLEFLKTKLTS
jgi:4-hydroxy-tetrahydrodipicolinate synthase